MAKADDTGASVTIEDQPVSVIQDNIQDLEAASDARLLTLVSCVGIAGGAAVGALIGCKLYD